MRGNLNQKRSYLTMDELAVMQIVMESRFKRPGYRCWACSKRAAKGYGMNWAIRPGIMGPELIFWDKKVCKDLLVRQGVL